MSTKTSHSTEGFVFTGKHMALVMVLFFGTIIAVNFTMAWFAHSSWSGLVVDNTYVASQQFNEKAALARKIEASGIKGALTVDGGAIAYQLSDPKADAVIADAVTLRFRRPVGDHQDFAVELTDAGHGRFTVSYPIIPGQWIVEAKAKRAGKVVMHEAVRIMVPGAE